MNGKETKWRYKEGTDPYAKAGSGWDFYGNPDHRANIIALPYEPAGESPDKEYPYLARRPAACSSTGTPAR